MPPIIDKNKCKKCGTCVQICPLNVLAQPQMLSDVEVRYPDECWHCRACILDCPADAITMRYPISHMVLHYKAGGESNENHTN